MPSRLATDMRSRSCTYAPSTEPSLSRTLSRVSASADRAWCSNPFAKLDTSPAIYFAEPVASSSSGTSVIPSNPSTFCISRPTSDRARMRAGQSFPLRLSSSVLAMF